MTQFISGLIGYTTVALIVSATLLGEGENSVFHKSRQTKTMLQYQQMASVRAEAQRAEFVKQDVARIEATNIVPVLASTSFVETESIMPQIEVKTGLVTASSVNLRDGPSTNYSRVGAVGGGEELVLTGLVDGDWIEVNHPTSGGKAWMHGAYLQRN